MRALLCTLNAKYIHTNLAIRILFEQNSHYPHLAWKEFTIKEDLEKTADFCAGYDLVAFSCYIWNISQTRKLCRLIKAKRPETKILLGGPEVSYDAESLLEDPDIDFVIRGEGEIPFSEFLKAFPAIENVPSLTYRGAEGIRSNPEPATFDVALFSASMPYRYDSAAELSNKVLYVETSRGCPYKCEFCLASLDNKVRYLPMEMIRNTLLFLMRHGRTIKFLDRTFNVRKDFTLEIFRFILSNRKEGNVFQFEITADILHPAIIEFIHAEVPPGVFRFEIGIQSVNQKANLSVSRKQSFEKTRKIIQELQYKIEMHLDLIIGLPFDEWADIRYSFEQVFRLYAPELQLGFLKFLKGTTMRQKPEHEYEFDPNPPYEIISSRYLKHDELEQLRMLENALEIYWNGKKATWTLRYVGETYSAFDFLLGLGKSFSDVVGNAQYGTNEIFDILAKYAADFFPGDQVLAELISLDYYLHFKVRPALRFGSALPSAEKQNVLARAGKAGSKNRFIACRIGFDAKKLLESNLLVRGQNLAIIEYNGVSKPAFLQLQEEGELVTISG